MSASIMPTLLPHFASAIARLTATVVLPTPPLPAPTAMTFLTPGTRLPRAVGADRLADARAHLHVDRGDARHLHHGGARLIAHLILDRTRRRRQLDGERDAAAIDLQVLDEPEADDVAVKIGIADDLQRLEHRAPVRLAYLKNIVHSHAHVGSLDPSPNRGVMIVLAYLWLLALVPLLVEKAGRRGAVACQARASC